MKNTHYHGFYRNLIANMQRISDIYESSNTGLSIFLVIRSNLPAAAGLLVREFFCKKIE